MSLKKICSATLSIAFCLTNMTPVFAVSVPPVNSGLLNQETAPPIPEAPKFLLPKLKSPAQKEQKKNGILIHVKKFDIYGNKLFKTSILEHLVKNAENKTMSLDQLTKVVSRITDFYRAKGYFLSRAYLPAQVLHHGIVKIKVLEAKYDVGHFDNKTKLHDGLIKKAIQNEIRQNEAVTVESIDHTIMLLSILSGEQAGVLLSPGSKPHTTDVGFDVQPISTWANSSVQFDDWGNPYTGAERFTGTLQVHNPLNIGDLLSVTGTVSGDISNFGEGPGLEYGHVAYTVPVSPAATTVTLGGTALDYKILGLAATTGYGHAYIFNFLVTQPIELRTNNSNFIQFEADQYYLTDVLGTSASSDDTRTLSDISLTDYGNTKTSFLFPGLISYNVSITAGNVDFTNGAAQVYDASGLKTGGSFYKANLNLNGTQNVSKTNSLTELFAGQLSSKNLDPAMELMLGGPSTIAAFPEGVFAGSQGFYGQVQFNHILSFKEVPGILSDNVFYDEGLIDVNRFQLTNGVNSAYIGGPGIGLTWSYVHWNASLSLSTPVGPQTSLVSSNVPGTVSTTGFNGVPIEGWGMISYTW